MLPDLREKLSEEGTQTAVENQFCEMAADIVDVPYFMLAGFFPKYFVDRTTETLLHQQAHQFFSETEQRHSQQRR